MERTKPFKLSYGYRDFIFLKDVRRQMWFELEKEYLDRSCGM